MPGKDASADARPGAPGMRAIAALALLLGCAVLVCACGHIRGADTGGDADASRDPERMLAALPDIDAIPESDLAADSYAPGMALARAMAASAWAAYATHAAPAALDEVRPVSGGGANMGTRPLYLTAVDALDTLHLLGLRDEYAAAREMAVGRLRVDAPGRASFFETNIRVLGGLLGAHALTGDAALREQALRLAAVMKANMDASGGLPPGDMDFGILGGASSAGHRRADAGAVRRFEQTLQKWAAALRPLGGLGAFYARPAGDASGVHELAVAGTLVLEFAYVSRLGGDRSYEDAAVAALRWLRAQPSDVPGLLPSFLGSAAAAARATYSLGAHADSYYEYLLKYALLRGDPREGPAAESRSAWNAALEAIREHLVLEAGGRLFLVAKTRAEDGSLSLVPRHEALACFAPGAIALHAMRARDASSLDLAERLAETCYAMNAESAAGLAPEAVAASAGPLRPWPGEGDWRQRPETLESLFYLWRATKRPRYRRWALRILAAVQRGAFVPSSGGYAVVADVRRPGSLADTQHSFLLAEVLKYAFLVFAPDDVLPLERFVLNTEAHPFPVEP